jgi:hypothetical protein
VLIVTSTLQAISCFLAYLIRTDVLSFRIQFAWGTVVEQWLRYCATNQKVAGSIPDGVVKFFVDINPSGVDSASNRTEYQEYFLGVNEAGA